MNLQPIGDRLIVRAMDDEESASSGVVLPDTAKEKPKRGKVLAAGHGKLDESGKRVPLDLKKGDEVLYSKYGGTEIKIDGEDLLVLRESDVLTKHSAPFEVRVMPAGLADDATSERLNELRHGVQTRIAQLRQFAK
jgi:chaperonin GroES